MKTDHQVPPVEVQTKLWQKIPFERPFYPNDTDQLQELEKILPECVKTQSTGAKTVESDNLTWYLINAVKELSAEVKALKAA